MQKAVDMRHLFGVSSRDSDVSENWSLGSCEMNEKVTGFIYGQRSLGTAGPKRKLKRCLNWAAQEDEREQSCNLRTEWEEEQKAETGLFCALGNLQRLLLCFAF